MRHDEIITLKYAGFKDSEIKNLRKVTRGKNFLTSDDTTKPDTFTLPIPPEARYFFGIGRMGNLKGDFRCSVVLNNETIIDSVNVQVLRLSRGIAFSGGTGTHEYIECGRRLTGSDTLLYKCNYGATIDESISWFFAIDITAVPKEGTTVKIVK